MTKERKRHPVIWGIVAAALLIIVVTNLGTTTPSDTTPLDPDINSRTGRVEVDTLDTEPDQRAMDQMLNNREMYEVVLGAVWESQTNDDQDLICMMYLTDPEVSVDQFMQGVVENDGDNVVTNIPLLRSTAHDFFREAC